MGIQRILCNMNVYGRIHRLQRPSAASASIDDAHFACFSLLADDRFARSRADPMVLLECLRS